MLLRNYFWRGCSICATIHRQKIGTVCGLSLKNSLFGVALCSGTIFALEPTHVMREQNGPPKLQVQDTHIGFGGLRALQRVSVDVHEGEIVAIISPNGAGKTTFLNAISGIY